MENSGFQKENLSISEAVLSVAKENLRKTAITYMGRKISYKKLYERIISLSQALYSLGVRKNEVVLVALPNIPQAVYVLYALNRIGAIPAFVSPLSAEYELEDYLIKCKAEFVISLDIMYSEFLRIFKRTGQKKLVLTGALDEVGWCFNKKKENVLQWKELLKSDAGTNVYLTQPKPWDTAVILFSGGTTGKPKPVELTNLNLNALSEGTESVCGEDVRNVKMLSALPVFHGFGLGICVHTVLYFGGECMLVPRFEGEKVGRIIKQQKPQYIALVPAMLSPIMKAKSMAKADLSNLLGVFSGGDSLSSELEDSFNDFLLNHNSRVRIRQGYGLTECVAASCLMPADNFRKESSGKPYPHTFYKIVKENTLEECENGCAGEICISGKTVMKGYLDDKDETEKVLRNHPDGKIWLHTGDMGYVDNDGFVYFISRIKRVIVSKGNNIYPSELEKALLKHSDVKECCAIGTKDSEKNEIAVMFAVLKCKEYASDEKAKELLRFLEPYVSKQSMPKRIYFIDEIPRTSLGKVAYTELINIAQKKTAEH